MLKFDGSTYTFLSYTISRIRGIMDYVNQNDLTELLNVHIIDQNELSELDFKVIKKLMCFTHIIENVDETKMIHGFVEFVSKLCVAFNGNYTNSRYLNFDESGKLISCNMSKLVMCRVVLDVLTTSCTLLGLQIVNEM
jgi:arginyl-tRNA synthetase